MIVRADGCYEYHLNHADVLASQDDTLRPALEVTFYLIFLNTFAYTSILERVVATRVTATTCHIEDWVCALC